MARYVVIWIDGQEDDSYAEQIATRARDVAGSIELALDRAVTQAIPDNGSRVDWRVVEAEDAGEARLMTRGNTGLRYPADNAWKKAGHFTHPRLADGPGYVVLRPILGVEVLISYQGIWLARHRVVWRHRDMEGVPNVPATIFQQGGFERPVYLAAWIGDQPFVIPSAPTAEAREAIVKFLRGVKGTSEAPPFFLDAAANWNGGKRWGGNAFPHFVPDWFLSLRDASDGASASHETRQAAAVALDRMMEIHNYSGPEAEGQTKGLGSKETRPAKADQRAAERPVRDEVWEKQGRSLRRTPGQAARGQQQAADRFKKTGLPHPGTQSTRRSWLREKGLDGFKISAKDPATMTAGEINKELDKLDAKSSELTTKLIEAGRGHERYNDIIKQSDPLSVEYRDVGNRQSALRNEVTQRYGPGHRGRLPTGRGFGPRKKVEGPKGLGVSGGGTLTRTLNDVRGFAATVHTVLLERIVKKRPIVTEPVETTIRDRLSATLQECLIMAYRAVIHRDETTNRPHPFVSNNADGFVVILREGEDTLRVRAYYATNPYEVARRWRNTFDVNTQTPRVPRERNYTPEFDIILSPSAVDQLRTIARWDREVNDFKRGHHGGDPMRWLAVYNIDDRAKREIDRILASSMSGISAGGGKALVPGLAIGLGVLVAGVATGKKVE